MADIAPHPDKTTALGRLLKTFTVNVFTGVYTEHEVVEGYGNLQDALALLREFSEMIPRQTLKDLVDEWKRYGTIPRSPTSLHIN